MRIKETYLWAIFFILVIAGAVYLRYYYQPQIGISVVFLNHPSGLFYPYEQINAPISVQNTGSSGISNLTFGLYMNGNVTRTYKISIPSGKDAVVNFNFTPTQYGNYTVLMVADPNNLYNIQDRNTARAALSLKIDASEAAQPDTVFSSNGLLGEDSYNMSTGGYVLSIFLLNNTASDEFELTNSVRLNSLLYPSLDVYYNYIKDIAVGDAYYKNYSLTSVWIKGYLTPAALGTVAIGKGFNVTSFGNVTVIDLGNGTTMCSWYSDGWIKTLSAVNGQSCTRFLNPSSYEPISSTLGSKLAFRNSVIYNYTGFFQNYSYSGQWSLEGNKSFQYQSIWKGPEFTNVCYGSIEYINNVSYCNTAFMYAGNVILLKTNALVGEYNLTVWNMSGVLQIANQINSNIQAVKHYNISGPSATYVSGFINSCYINSNVICYNSIWDYNTLNVTLVNGYNSSMYIDNFACFNSGNPNYTSIDQTVTAGNFIRIDTPCYSNSTAIAGVPLGLAVHLLMHYQVSNQTDSAEGYAQLVN